MGLKKKSRKKRELPDPHAKGAARCRQALEIVATDNTFNLGFDSAGPLWIGRCLHCNTAMYVRTNGGTDATVEHIVPTSKGGSGTDLMNLALACKECNNEKGVRHDQNYPRDKRACEVIGKLLEKRSERWRKPPPEMVL